MCIYNPAMGSSAARHVRSSCAHLLRSDNTHMHTHAHNAHAHAHSRTYTQTQTQAALL